MVKLLHQQTYIVLASKLKSTQSSRSQKVEVDSLQALTHQRSNIAAINLQISCHVRAPPHSPPPPPPGWWPRVHPRPSVPSLVKSCVCRTLGGISIQKWIFKRNHFWIHSLDSIDCQNSGIIFYTSPGLRSIEPEFLGPSLSFKNYRAQSKPHNIPRNYCRL